MVFFFLLGVFARLVRSDLRMPEVLYEILSIYLLLAIGLKGGVELSKQALSGLVPQVAAAALLSLLIPCFLYPLFRLLKRSVFDSAALGAHFGSVSVVTFSVATASLTDLGIPFESHSPLWVAVMEVPGLVTGVLLARRFGHRGSPSGSPAAGWGSLLHEVLLGKSVLLLLGGLAIGAVAGPQGLAPIEAVFVTPFKGVLALFLLELGLVAGSQLAEVRRFGLFALGVGLLVPPCLGLLGALVGTALGLSLGGVAILATLAASASYIAAPTAMRIAVPEANPALSITIALGITFPFNVLVGIPLYIQLATFMASP